MVGCLGWRGRARVSLGRLLVGGAWWTRPLPWYHRINHSHRTVTMHLYARPQLIYSQYSVKGTVSRDGFGFWWRVWLVLGRNRGRGHFSNFLWFSNDFITNKCISRGKCEFSLALDLTIDVINGQSPSRETIPLKFHLDKTKTFLYFVLHFLR